LRGDCLITVIQLLSDPVLRGPVKPTQFPMGEFWKEWIEGWPEGDCFQIVPTGINVSGVSLLLLTAAPLGRIKGGCFLGGTAA
jgi:hypothetical protein